ncbi:cyclic nucleotide-binding domain-containing protein [Kitasatospora sp. NPDC096140]|uniref:cyclic nucleotide-binding domain-containing protein n=1 Tax=Kitasatospora sp. NPDC096140 TaxID=3155425 RepID=UPI0033223828
MTDHGHRSPDPLGQTLCHLMGHGVWTDMLEDAFERRHPIGATLLRQGEPGTHVLALLAGVAKVCRRERNGDVRLLAFRGPGELLGEVAVLDDGARSASVHAICLAAKPVCRFLRTRGLLIDDPDLHRDRDLVWIDRVLAALPQRVAEEVRTWADVLRTQGPREDEPRSWESIRSYLTHLRPALTAWAQAGMTSLREATADHLQDALDDLDGAARRQLTIALRSLFKALKRERLVFRDLARHLPVGDLTGIPRPVPPTCRPACSTTPPPRSRGSPSHWPLSTPSRPPRSAPRSPPI